jgi:FtsP/CotA-like multicopper oxidase with cupredoxin domain
MSKSARRANRDRLVVAIVLTVGIVGALGWYWSRSLIPSTYSVLGMGYADFGGGRVDPQHATHAHSGWEGPSAKSGDVSVASLTGPQEGTPDVAVTLTARKESFTLPSGERQTGYTLNHSSPGPLVTARQGDLVQVTLINESVPDGTALHWHGIDVPNAEDGVAGVTQDAVALGERHVYRFEAADAGTYWYHSHQASHPQTRGGLFGAFVVTPRDSVLPDVDVVAPLHSYASTRTMGGQSGERHQDLLPGKTARVRLIATDPGPVRAWVSGAPYRIVAVDGRDVHEPGLVENKTVIIGAGGRIDIEVTGPADGSAVRVNVGGGTSLMIGPPGATAPVLKQPSEELDLLTYGSPAPIGFDASQPARQFDYRIGRRPGLFDGRPGFYWTINGGLFPDVPMYVVDKGDVVVMTIKNESGHVHPMHLHGHHAVVLSRNGVKASGSPWWVDSLNVKGNETYEIAFLADNPGIWMDHCHNLPHASEGLMTHLAYTGVSVPFRIGGNVGNTPE